MATVLIVDDDAAMRDALGEAARDLGYDARLAASGTEAIDFLEARSVDAVLLDLRMPGMDGVEVLRRICSRLNPPVALRLNVRQPIQCFQWPCFALKLRLCS
jgi:CheY-like chemotaxis protein